MLRINGLKELAEGSSEIASLKRLGTVATIGVFDGVHMGHFAVIKQTIEKAHQNQQKGLVVTFAGHPKQTLRGRAPATITSLDHRLRIFEQIGVDAVLVIEFDETLRELSAVGFLENFLIPHLGLKGLVLGFDSKFGKNREGTFENLKPDGKRLGIFLEEVAPLTLEDRAVSSTAIREAVTLGELNRAAEMLGRPVSLLGTVIHGDGRGRQIGFPTANLRPHHELQPPNGVYACYAQIGRLDREGWKTLHPSVVNIGNRPSFDDASPSIEAHLLNLSADLYGRSLELHFLHCLRDEMPFSDIDLLKKQIQFDIDNSKEEFKKAPKIWRIPGQFLAIEGSRLQDFIRS